MFKDKVMLGNLVHAENSRATLATKIEEYAVMLFPVESHIVFIHPITGEKTGKVIGYEVKEHLKIKVILEDGKNFGVSLKMKPEATNEPKSL